MFILSFKLNMQGSECVAFVSLSVLIYLLNNVNNEFKMCFWTIK